MMGRTFVLKVLGPMSFQTNDRCITIMIVATPNRCRSYTFINNIHVMMYIYACCMLIKIGGVNRQLQLQGQTDKLIMSPHSQNHTVVFTIISNLPNSLQILKTFQPAETVKGCILHLPWFWTSTIPADFLPLVHYFPSLTTLPDLGLSTPHPR